MEDIRSKLIASTGPSSFRIPEGHVIVRTIAIAGISLELVERGQRRPLLLGDGPSFAVRQGDDEIQQGKRLPAFSTAT